MEDKDVLELLRNHFNKKLKRYFNKMENKYYTPEISEFHVGFEYEHLKQNGVWHKQTTKSYTLVRDFDTFHGRDISLTLQACINENLVRVKYLDREDIESLGFKHTENKPDGWSYDKFNIYSNPKYTEWTLKLSYLRKAALDKLYITNREIVDEILITSFHPDNGKGDIVFVGRIKNKSELIKLMKQLGIND